MSWVLACLLHHLHHHAHGAGHLAHQDGRGVLEATGDRDFADCGLKLILEPKREGSDILLWDATEGRNVVIFVLAKILRNLLV